MNAETHPLHVALILKFINVQVVVKNTHKLIFPAESIKQISSIVQYFAETPRFTLCVHAWERERGVCVRVDHGTPGQTPVCVCVCVQGWKQAISIHEVPWSFSWFLIIVVKLHLKAGVLLYFLFSVYYSSLFLFLFHFISLITVLTDFPSAI